MTLFDIHFIYLCRCEDKLHLGIMHDHPRRFASDSQDSNKKIKSIYNGYIFKVCLAARPFV